MSPVFELLNDDVLAAWSHEDQGLAFASEPSVRRASAVLFSVGAVLYPAWHWVFLAVMPTARDPLGERLMISLLIAVAIIGCRVRSAWNRHMPAVEQFLMFVLTAHYFSCVWRNDLAAPYVLGTYTIVASCSVIITRPAIAWAYSIFCLSAVVLMGALDGHPTQLDWILGMLTILTGITLGAHRDSAIRDAAMSRVSLGRQLIKEIIETIPDPVFVRKRDFSTVFANQAGRQFENATGYDMAAVVELERRALDTNYTIESDVEVRTQRGPISVAVKSAVRILAKGQLMLVTIMRDVTDRQALQASLRQKVDELEAARVQVRQLQGILPICMHCSRIRIGEGQWEKVETYVAGHSSASFTHTLCASCLEEHHPA